MLNNRPKGKDSKLATFLLIIVIFAPLTFFWALNWFATADSFSVGITGFVQSVIVNGCLGLLTLIIAIVSSVKLAQPETPFKQKLIRIVIIIVCLVAAFLLLRPIFLDIPYLNNPQAAYLDRLKFDDEMGVGDSPTNYYLRGYDMDGERHSFEISEERWEEGRERLW